MRSRRYTRNLVALLATLLALAAPAAVAFLLGRVTVSNAGRSRAMVRVNIDDDREWPMSEQADRFAELLGAWDEYVIQHDGFLPGDPYKVLEGSGKLGGNSIRDFEFAQPIPVRINSSLSQNPRWVMFWQNRRDLGEVWCAYADGSWARVPVTPSPLKFGGSNTPDVWRAVPELADSHWESLHEREAWARRYGPELSWDPALRAFRIPAGRTRPN